MKRISVILALSSVIAFAANISAGAFDATMHINGMKSDVNAAQSVSSGLAKGENSVRVEYITPLAAQKDNIKTILALYCDGILSDVKIIKSTPVAQNAYIPRATAQFTVSDTAKEFFVKPFFFEDFENLKPLNNVGKEKVASGSLAENKIVVDGETLEVNENEQAFTNPSWLYLEDNNGYVFLQDAEIAVKREMSGNGSTFAVITNEHGENPENAQYAYAIIPHASEAETKNYAQNPSVELIEISENVHVILDKTTEKYYVNVFDGECCSDDMGVTLSVCSAIIKKQDSKNYEFNIADPTHSNEVIKVEFLSDVKSISGIDASFVTYDGNVVLVDTASRPGSTFTFTVELSN